MKIKRILPFLFLPFSIFAQNLSKIETAISLPRETVQLSGLKTYYLAGEKIDLSALVTESLAKQPSDISIPLYVDLIDLNEGKLVENFILKLEKGSAKMNYKLPINLPSSNYQIRAYTNWMRNFSEDYFFKQNFPVFSQNYKNEIKNNTTTAFDNLSYYPEGGVLVSSLKNKIIIKTLDNFGEPIVLDFELKNNKNEVLISSKTNLDGLGFVDFIPNQHEKYYFEVANKSFPIANIQPSGTNLLLDNLSNKDKIKVIVQNTADHVSADSLSFLLIHDGQIVFKSRFLNKKQELMFFVQKDKLPEGILQGFLIDNSSNTLANRTLENHKNQKADLNSELKLMLKANKEFFVFRNQFQPEKGISISGQLKKVSGRALKKEESISVVLTDYDTDSITNKKPITFFAKAKDKFVVDDLEFYGKKQVTFVCPYAQVLFDSTQAITEIKKENLPINWKLVSTSSENLELEKRKEEAINNYLTEQKKNTISLDAVSVKALRNDDPFDKFANSTPTFTLKDENLIQTFPSTTEVVGYLLSMVGGGNPHMVVKVIVNNFENPVDILNDIRLGTIEKLDVYRNAEAAIYNCDIAINITLFTSRSFSKKNSGYIVNGYYKSSGIAQNSK